MAKLEGDSVRIDESTLIKLTDLTKAVLDEDGREIVNPMPLAVPTELNRPLTLKEQICRVLTGERMRKLVDQQGQETFEEANDFDVPDEEPMPMSSYELEDMEYEEPISNTPTTKEAVESENTSDSDTSDVTSDVPPDETDTPPGD